MSSDKRTALRPKPVAKEIQRQTALEAGRNWLQYVTVSYSLSRNLSKYIVSICGINCLQNIIFRGKRGKHTMFNPEQKILNYNAAH